MAGQALGTSVQNRAATQFDTLAHLPYTPPPFHEPPEHTRAYFRGKCLERFADDIVSANWDSVVFDVGGPSLQRVPMLEPSRGTAATVGELIEGAASAADLIERLRGDAGPGMRR